MSTLDVLGYTVHIEAGLLREVGHIAHTATPAHRYVVITDSGVATHWVEPVLQSIRSLPSRPTASSYTFMAGEQRKTRDTWAAITDWMLSAGCGRDTTVVALGGGVVGDVAGFVAATFMRGVPVVQVPTSLLAMVDASVGGKTGVDTPAGKNLVGAFHQPAAVVIDPGVLSTLPQPHLRAGMAEVMKHGAIADADYFSFAGEIGAQANTATGADTPMSWSSEQVQHLIAGSVAIKASVVGRDERESGVRQLLNAGHTVAHAIEVASAFEGLHGDAVAIGLVLEARMAEQSGVAKPGLSDRMELALQRLGLPTVLPRAIDIDFMIATMYRDKKARRGRPMFALLSDIGVPAGSDQSGWSQELPQELVRDVLQHSSSMAHSSESPTTAST